MRRSEDGREECRQQIRFFHQPESVAKTSLVTKTHTPITKCKYLDLSKVGSRFLGSKMCCLGEQAPRNTKYEAGFDRMMHGNLILILFPLFFVATSALFMEMLRPTILHLILIRNVHLKLLDLQFTFIEYLYLKSFILDFQPNHINIFAVLSRELSTNQTAVWDSSKRGSKHSRVDGADDSFTL